MIDIVSTEQTWKEGYNSKLYANSTRLSNVTLWTFGVVEYRIKYVCVYHGRYMSRCEYISMYVWA